MSRPPSSFGVAPAPSSLPLPIPSDLDSLDGDYEMKELSESTTPKGAFTHRPYANDTRINTPTIQSQSQRHQNGRHGANARIALPFNRAMNRDPPIRPSPALYYDEQSPLTPEPVNDQVDDSAASVTREAPDQLINQSVNDCVSMVHSLPDLFAFLNEILHSTQRMKEEAPRADARLKGMRDHLTQVSNMNHRLMKENVAVDLMSSAFTNCFPKSRSQSASHQYDASFAEEVQLLTKESNNRIAAIRQRHDPTLLIDRAEEELKEKIDQRRKKGATRTMKCIQLEAQRECVMDVVMSQQQVIRNWIQPNISRWNMILEEDIESDEADSSIRELLSNDNVRIIHQCNIEGLIDTVDNEHSRVDQPNDKESSVTLERAPRIVPLCRPNLNLLHVLPTEMLIMEGRIAAWIEGRSLSPLYLLGPPIEGDTNAPGQSRYLDLVPMSSIDDEGEPIGCLTLADYEHMIRLLIETVHEEIFAIQDERIHSLRVNELRSRLEKWVQVLQSTCQEERLKVNPSQARLTRLRRQSNMKREWIEQAQSVCTKAATEVESLLSKMGDSHLSNMNLTDQYQGLGNKLESLQTDLAPTLASMLQSCQLNDSFNKSNKDLQSAKSDLTVANIECQNVRTEVIALEKERTQTEGRLNEIKRLLEEESQQVNQATGIRFGQYQNSIDYLLKANSLIEKVASCKAKFHQDLQLQKNEITKEFKRQFHSKNFPAIRLQREGERKKIKDQVDEMTNELDQLPKRLKELKEINIKCDQAKRIQEDVDSILSELGAVSGMMHANEKLPMDDISFAAEFDQLCNLNLSIRAKEEMIRVTQESSRQVAALSNQRLQRDARSRTGVPSERVENDDVTKLSQTESDRANPPSRRIDQGLKRRREPIQEDQLESIDIGRTSKRGKHEDDSLLYNDSETTENEESPKVTSAMLKDQKQKVTSLLQQFDKQHKKLKDAQELYLNIGGECSKKQERQFETAAQKTRDELASIVAECNKADKIYQSMKAAVRHKNIPSHLKVKSSIRDSTRRKEEGRHAFLSQTPNECNKRAERPVSTSKMSSHSDHPKAMRRLPSSGQSRVTAHTPSRSDASHKSKIAMTMASDDPFAYHGAESAEYSRPSTTPKNKGNESQATSRKRR